MKKSGLLLGALLVWLLLAATPGQALEGQLAEEFAFLSNQTRVALELSAVELQGLIERCDRLLLQCDALAAGEKKIMRRKIERLRGLFLYVLQSKHVVQSEQPGT